jgi:hypothetical protein
MAAKKAKKSKKGKKKSGLNAALRSGIEKGMKRSAKTQRPLPFLKKMALKMKKNLPKLEAIIKQRGG